MVRARGSSTFLHCCLLCEAATSHGLAADMHHSCDFCMSASLTSVVKGCPCVLFTSVLKLSRSLLKHLHDRWQVNAKIQPIFFFFRPDLCFDSLPITHYSDLLWTLWTLWIRYSAAALFTSPSFQTNFPLKTIQPQSLPLPGIYLSPHKLFSILHRLTAIPLRLQIQGLGTHCMLICIGVTRWDTPPCKTPIASAELSREADVLSRFSADCQHVGDQTPRPPSGSKAVAAWATATTACRTEQQIIAPWKAPLLWSQHGVRYCGWSIRRGTSSVKAHHIESDIASNSLCLRDICQPRSPILWFNKTGMFENLCFLSLHETCRHITAILPV